MTEERNRNNEPGNDEPERAAQHLADPALTLDLNAELAAIRAQESWQRSGRHAKTLVKDAELRVVLIALQPGARLEEHHAPGRITIHTLAGHLTVRVAGQTIELPVGHVLTLARSVPHDVEARGESAFLLTIAWPASPAGALPTEGA